MWDFVNVYGYEYPLEICPAGGGRRAGRAPGDVAAGWPGPGGWRPAGAVRGPHLLLWSLEPQELLHDFFEVFGFEQRSIRLRGVEEKT